MISMSMYNIGRVWTGVDVILRKLNVRRGKGGPRREI
jgi:hypothetical protein